MCFIPSRMAQRILGMGDITTLVEKAQAQFDEEQAKSWKRRSGRTSLISKISNNSWSRSKKMGNIKDLLGMIPGVGKAVKDIDISDDSFKGIEAMINSMTYLRRRNPDLIDMSRKKRIAKGSRKGY